MPSWSTPEPGAAAPSKWVPQHERAPTSTVALTHAAAEVGLECTRVPSGGWLTKFQYAAPVGVAAWLLTLMAWGQLTPLTLLLWSTVTLLGWSGSCWALQQRQLHLMQVAERLASLAEVRFGRDHEVTQRAQHAYGELSQAPVADAELQTRMEASLRYTEELLLSRAPERRPPPSSSVLTVG